MNAPAQGLRMLLRVRYADCDAQGIVFNARYAEYVDVLMGELVRAAFGSYQAMLDERRDTHLVRYAIDWSAPARFDDVLALTVTRLEFGRTSFTAGIDIRRHPGGAALARAEVVNVLIDTGAGAKTAISAAFRARLLAATAGGLADFSGGALRPAAS